MNEKKNVCRKPEAAQPRGFEKTHATLYCYVDNNDRFRRLISFSIDIYRRQRRELHVPNAFREQKKQQLKKL